jgi:hypothetical protein
MVWNGFSYSVFSEGGSSSSKIYDLRGSFAFFSIEMHSFEQYFFPMSTVTEVKSATKRLSTEQRWELYRWLGTSKDVQRLRHEELRREIAAVIEQANRGDLAPLNISSIKEKVRSRLNKKGA